MRHLSKLVLLSALVAFAIGAKYQAHRRAAFASVPTYEWLTNFTTTTLRSDADIWVGVSLTPSANLTVTHIGRRVVAGNTQTHTVRFSVNGGPNFASVTVDTTTGTPGQIHYTAITPFTLTNGQAYILASREFLAGDQWYDAGAAGHAMVRADKATSNDAAYSNDGTVGVSFSTLGAGANAQYVPVSFKFQ